MNQPLRIGILIIVTVLIFLLLWRVRMLLTPFFLSIIFAYLLNPIINTLEKKEVPRSLAIIITYVAFSIAFAISFILLLPLLTKELESLIRILPKQTEMLEDITFNLMHELRELPIPEVINFIFDTVIIQIQALLSRTAERVGDMIISSVRSIFYLFLAPVLAYFLLRDWPSLQKKILLYFPMRYKPLILELSQRINKVLSGFIRGQLVISLILGLFVAAGLAILGVKYALFVGLIVGAFDIIPYFGPIIGALPAIALGFLDSPMTAIWVAMLLVVLNQLEGAILSPRLIGSNVGLHPVTVIFAVLAGAEIQGILGMLLAVPLAAIFKVTWQVFIERIYNTSDKSEEISQE